MTILEMWLPLPGLKREFLISNKGNIKGIDRLVNHWRGGRRKIKSKERKSLVAASGYLMCSLKRGINVLVHRKVAIAFLKNPDNKKCVNHKNGIKTDNNASNLEWATYSENEKHSYSVLGKKPNKTGQGKKGILHHQSIPVARYIGGRLVGVYGGASAAAEALKMIGYPKASQSRISCNARGETINCYKSQFKYISKLKYNKLCKKAITS